jgi:hypothetical protein
VRRAGGGPVDPWARGAERRDLVGSGRSRCGLGRSDPWEAGLDQSGASGFWSPGILRLNVPAHGKERKISRRGCRQVVGGNWEGVSSGQQ